MNFRYQIIKNNEILPYCFHGNALSAAKNYVDTHGKCSIWDNKEKKIIYPEKKEKKQ